MRVENSVHSMMVCVQNYGKLVADTALDPMYDSVVANVPASTSKWQKERDRPSSRDLGGVKHTHTESKLSDVFENTGHFSVRIVFIFVSRDR